MAMLTQTKTIVRTIAKGAADDADWPTTGAVVAAHLDHPGGTLSLFFTAIDAGGTPVARGSATFTHEVMRHGGDAIHNGTSVSGQKPNSHWVSEDAPAGGYVVRVTSKTSFPAGSASLRIEAQAG